MATHFELEGSSVVITDRATGVTRRVSFRNRTLAEAAARVMKMREEDNEPLPFSEFVERWKEHHAELRFVDRTRSCYYSLLEYSILPYFGTMLLPEITAERVRDFVGMLRSTGRRGRSITPLLMKLQAVLGVAKKWGYIDKNPVAEVDAIFLDINPFVTEPSC